MKLKLGQLVEVRWFDITSYPGWHSDDNWEVTECASVGFVVRETKIDLAIAQDMADINDETNEAEQCGNVMLIPKANIRRIKILRRVR